MTSKQRAYLRGLANTMEPIVHVGKEGVSENMVRQLSEALEARELIKAGVQENCDYTSREAADAVAERLNADVVQVIGRKFVLWRRSSDPKKRVIELD